MHVENDEKLKGQIILIDPYLHKKGNLRKEEFLKRIKDVKYLRTSYNSNYLTFYITSINEYNNLIKFHKLVNNGIFNFDNSYVFAVAIQPKLYNWIKTTNISIIQKQIVTWLASLYYFNPDKRKIQKKQIYKPLFEEIENIIEVYYKNFELPNFIELTDRLFENNDDTIIKEHKKCQDKYIQVCKDYYGTKPPEFLTSPTDYENIKEWGVNEHFGFEFIEAYLNDKDWDRIVIKGNCNDDMQRAESLDDLLLKWKHIYTTFEERKNFVYDFFYEDTPKKKRRESIPKNVKNEVWKRDNGVCTECGSNENLEFDHIIPFSKGGSSTYRNLQLLCERCNRTKKDKI